MSSSSPSTSTLTKRSTTTSPQKSLDNNNNNEKPRAADANSSLGKRPSSTTVSSSDDRKKRRISALRRLVNLYFKYLNTHPILTKASTQAFLSFLGNLVAQKLIKRQPLDWMVIFSFTASSFCCGPVIHYWYQILNRHVKSLPMALFLDQVPFSFLYSIYFFALLRIFNRFQVKMIATDVKQNLWPTMVSSWKFWPIAQLINLKFVPAQYQVLFGNVLGFIWSIVFASISG